MAIKIKSINSDLSQQIFRAKATSQRIAITIRSALLSTEKSPLPHCAKKEDKQEIIVLQNALKILVKQ